MQKNDFNELEKNLGVKFENPELLKQAFIHRSYLNEVKINLPSNERLEFLGDSVLSLIISNYLYDIRPTDSEGQLTNLRAYLVKTKSLSQAAKKLNLGSYLNLSKGEEQGGGRNNPQLLANTFEAVLGAIFLDQGFEKAQQFVKKTLLSLFEEELKMGPPKDAKSNLQEITQEKFKQSPHYKILKTEGPDHAKKFQVAVFILGKELGKGEGPSKQIAEEQAATQALEKLTE
ncbi:ribonuclease III [Candidatus Daviesbacteria bacterium]|nr:ribonuclease III [Candidatus Daviesbacteria bacterium]